MVQGLLLYYEAGKSNPQIKIFNRILHFLEHKYEIAHATVQMEYQPCSGPECHLNTMHAGHDHHHHH